MIPRPLSTTFGSIIETKEYQFSVKITMAAAPTVCVPDQNVHVLPGLLLGPTEVGAAAMVNEGPALSGP